MCVSPSWVWVLKGPNYQKITVPCKVCWRCNENRISDFTGRGLAEAAYSDWVVVVTLTYRNREYDLHDKVIHPPHFQEFIRSMRDRRPNNKIRYFCAGEVGKDGKAHFHVTLFGVGPKLGWPHKERHWVDEWPHGHIFPDLDGDDRAIRYSMKYLHKDAEAWVTMSKKPPLGAPFFEGLAAKHVGLGVLPRSFEYIPPGAREGKRYLMTGATRRDYVLAVCRGFAKRRKLDLRRLSEWVRMSLEKAEKRDLMRSIERYIKENPDECLANLTQGLKDDLDSRRMDHRKAVSIGLQAEVEAIQNE